jgi:hypothetical protein
MKANQKAQELPHRRNGEGTEEEQDEEEAAAGGGRRRAVTEVQESSATSDSIAGMQTSLRLSFICLSPCSERLSYWLL